MALPGDLRTIAGGSPQGAGGVDCLAGEECLAPLWGQALRRLAHRHGTSRALFRL